MSYRVTKEVIIALSNQVASLSEKTDRAIQNALDARRDLRVAEDALARAHENYKSNTKVNIPKPS